jgi:allantoin racemase
MTRAIGAAAERVARPGTRITALNPTDTPPAIQGAEDGEAALPGLFRLFDAEVVERGGYDACIVACFDDTGLMALKARSPVPVIGIGEAAYQAAMLLGTTFAVVTTLGVSVPVLEENLVAYGYAGRCTGVRASEVPVLALEDDREGSRARIAEEIGAALASERPEAVALGCAGMADLAAELSNEFQLPVIDGVVAAVAFAEALEQTGLGRSIGGRGGA